VHADCWKIAEKYSVEQKTRLVTSVAAKVTALSAPSAAANDECNDKHVYMMYLTASSGLEQCLCTLRICLRERVAVDTLLTAEARSALFNYEFC
jgi:hypothetical protein